METEIEQARESIKEYRKGYGQSQLSTDCIIQLMILHAKKQLAANRYAQAKPEVCEHNFEPYYNWCSELQGYRCEKCDEEKEN